MHRKRLLLSLSMLLTIVITPSMLSAAQIKLAWDANPEGDLAGYKIYYGTSQGVYGTPVNAGNVTTYTLTGLTSGQTYYMALTALDSGGNESTYSSEVSGVAKDPVQTVAVTVATNPAGRQVLVDGTAYTATQTFT